MKKSSHNFLLVALIATTLSSCSKKETFTDVVPEKDDLAQTSIYTIPLGTGTHNDTLTIHLNLPPINYPLVPDDTGDGSTGEHTWIEFLNPDYLKETCLLDISKLKAGYFYHQIGTKSFSVAFFDRDEERICMQKLKANKPTPLGWSSEWNIPPYVEKKNPEVLFNSTDNGSFTFVLSKPCTEFGFELTPNIQGENVNYTVIYGNYQYDGTSGEIQPLTVYNPGLARIFALKAKKSFTVVEVISYDDPDEVGYTAGGSAITNIRYTLAQ
ncbi:hypothetical protein ADIARSV_4148 [Arcticibacter svalbardensis MN12-7]|uniref:Lipoprotein n=1 Tax=Arcticibacter svalbardensis MN12-7 TaxID=1150600 RepID=R9GLR6_9SPHI|nr:hypothetical protein [Arcticibacter svalbardensis]EOR92636.1 hypothetical protein ADIARSV_4148 [Arcticibacter svalbardensis MN12-7]